MDAFVRIHLSAFRDEPLEILDFGSQMVDGQELSYVEFFDDPAWNYRGLDIEAGVNVDIVVEDPYDWTSVESDSTDLVISGQAFEHVEFFWGSMFEIIRVLKPGGVATIIAPSGGFEHRYPVDCWRFYKDGFAALSRYVECDLIDVFTDWGNLDWEDSILVVRKPQWDADGRRRFASRAAMQRALLSDSTPDLTTIELSGDTPEVSAMNRVQVGALTAELTGMRMARLEHEASVAAAEAAATEARIDAEAARRTEERLAAIPAMQTYLRARNKAGRIIKRRG